MRVLYAVCICDAMPINVFCISYVYMRVACVYIVYICWCVYMLVLCIFRCVVYAYVLCSVYMGVVYYVYDIRVMPMYMCV